MEIAVECDCGWTTRGAEVEVVEATRAHGREAYGIDLSRDQVLAAARPATGS